MPTTVAKRKLSSLGVADADDHASRVARHGSDPISYTGVLLRGSDECSADALQCPELPGREALREKIDHDSCATIAPEMASPAEEVAERETRLATAPADREWSRFADTIRALSRVNTTTSVEPMWKELAQAIQTDSLLSASRESAWKKSFLQELQTLRRVIDK